MAESVPSAQYTLPHSILPMPCVLAMIVPGEETEVREAKYLA